MNQHQRMSMMVRELTSRGVTILQIHMIKFWSKMCFSVDSYAIVRLMSGFVKIQQISEIIFIKHKDSSN